MSITKKDILNLLQSIKIPSENKSLVHFDILKDLSIENSIIELEMNPTMTTLVP